MEQVLAPRFEFRPKNPNNGPTPGLDYGDGGYANVNRKALEALLQKFFGKARLDLELKDRFGSPVEPREWFLVPLPVIDEAIQKIKEGAIGSFRYDPETARLTPA